MHRSTTLLLTTTAAWTDLSYVGMVETIPIRFELSFLGDRQSLSWSLKRHPRRQVTHVSNMTGELLCDLLMLLFHIMF
jgi:hypothetical protein